MLRTRNRIGYVTIDYNYRKETGNTLEHAVIATEETDNKL